MADSGVSSAERVSVIIVTWNSGQLLKNCLDSVAKVYGTRLEIIVVDNGNLRETENIARQYPNVTYVPSPNNVGFAGGNNIGMKYVTREYVLLLNDDTVFHGDSLSTLVRFLDEHEKVGVVQGTMNVPAWNNGLDECGALLTFYGLLKYPDIQKPTATTKLAPRRVFSVKGALMLFRRNIIKDVGGFLFYDHFFNYYEEKDFCHRVNNAGWECWFVPTLPIDHLNGQTSARLKSDDVWVQYIANILYSFCKNFGFWRKVTTLPIFFVGVFLGRPKQTIRALKRNANRW